MFSGPSVSTKLTNAGNRPSGFDYMRIVLALAVICWHSQLISYGGNVTSGSGVLGLALDLLTVPIVPMFFALSGFLVAGSLERTKSLFNFLGLRVFRIMPALAVEVVLSALILGPILTSLSLTDYFAAPLLHSYFWNIFGHIHYLLPGVFQENPVHIVNGQLWTVPYELVCYMLLAALLVVGIVRRRNLLLAFLVACYAAQVLNGMLRPSTEYQGAGGSSVVMAFVTGVLFYRYRDRIPYSRIIFIASLVLFVALLMFVPKGMRFAAVPIAYMTVYLGLMTPPRNKLLLSGDYSYGLYLYGFPIQQAVWTFGPEFQTWYASILVSVPLTAVFATASWWLVEKPVLQRRGVLVTMENRLRLLFPTARSSQLGSD